MVKAHPCLKIDFQVFLRNDGAVLNIDLDRCDVDGVKQKLALLARIPGLCESPSLIKLFSTRRSGSFTSVSANSPCM